MKRTSPDSGGPQNAARYRKRVEVLLASDFVGCLPEAPSDLAADHRRYLIESFGRQRDVV